MCRRVVTRSLAGPPPLFPGDETVRGRRTSGRRTPTGIASLPASASNPEIRGATYRSSGRTDPTVAYVHALGSQKAGLFDLVAGHQPTR